MMIQKLKGDDDDDEKDIDASSKGPVITKSHVASSTKTLGTASSSSLSTVSSQIPYYVHAWDDESATAFDADNTSDDYYDDIVLTGREGSHSLVICLQFRRLQQ